MGRRAKTNPSSSSHDENRDHGDGRAQRPGIHRPNKARGRSPLRPFRARHISGPIPGRCPGLSHDAPLGLLIDGSSVPAKHADYRPTETRDHRPAETHDHRPAETHDHRPAETHDHRLTETHRYRRNETHGHRPNGTTCDSPGQRPGIHRPNELPP